MHNAPYTIHHSQYNRILTTHTTHHSQYNRGQREKEMVQVQLKESKADLARFEQAQYQ
jgi:hypothetical protein